MGGGYEFGVFARGGVVFEGVVEIDLLLFGHVMTKELESEKYNLEH